MFRKAYLAAAALLASLSLVPVPAAATGLTVKDGAGTTQVLCAAVQADGTLGYCFQYHDSTGAQVDLATKAQAASLALAAGAPTDPYSVATDGSSASEIALLKGEIYELKAVFALLGSPAQAGGNVVLTGSLPNFATTPTVNLGTLGGAATAAAQAAEIAALSPNITYVGTSTVLAASATYTGVSRDTGSAPGTGTPYSYFNASFYSDQAGTAYLDASNDGSTWVPIATSAYTAATPLTLTTPVMFRYHRARFVNGATAQTTFVANSSYTAS